MKRKTTKTDEPSEASLAEMPETALEKAVFTSCSGAVQSADQSAQLPAVAQSSAPSLNAPM